mmetsp:Transcript_97309/g.275351  ORF Transcript_97309/g.275351 Transcript_97309/m.275351 type:complete len:341 (-) Transcript_97309:1191-2213(-)
MVVVALGSICRVHVTILDRQLVVGAQHGRENVHVGGAGGRQVRRDVVHDTSSEAVDRAAGRAPRARVAHTHAPLEVVPEPEDVACLVRDHVPQALAEQLLSLGGRQWPPGSRGHEAHLLAPLAVAEPARSAPHPGSGGKLQQAAGAVAGRAGIGAGLVAEAARLPHLVREVGRQEVEVAQPGADPAVGHQDVALEDLPAARVDLGNAHAYDLVTDGPRECAEAHVADVVVAWPVRVARQDRTHGRGPACKRKRIVPSLHALAEPPAPAVGHRGVHVDADLLVGQGGDVVAPYRGDAPVDALARKLVRQGLVLAEVPEVSGEVQQPLVRGPRPHWHATELQ